MTKSRSLSKLVLVVIVTVFFFGCKEAPQMQIDAAKATLDSALTAGANLYMVAEYNALQDSFNVAIENVEKQNSKFSLLRNYSKSEAQLVTVKEMASKLITDTKAKIEAMK